MERKINALAELGIAKEWHKDSMHRLYIDLTKADDLYYANDNTEHARLPINRNERMGGKLWIDLDNGEWCSRSISDVDGLISCIEELIPAEKTDSDAETAEEAQPAAERQLTEAELYDLCTAASVTARADGKLAVPVGIPDALKKTLKAHKEEIVSALSGYCFSRDVYTRRGLHRWQILKVPTTTDARFYPVVITTGTATEVDAWARDHKDDPLFTDLYTAKYTYVHVTED